MTVSPGGRIRAGPRAAWRGTLAAMPQVQLPVFPAGATLINDALACEFRDGQAVYFNGHLPVGTHAEDDLASIRFFTTQLIVNGSATQGEIARAFGVPRGTVKRCVKRHRTRRGGGVRHARAPARGFAAHRRGARRRAGAAGAGPRRARDRPADRRINEHLTQGHPRRPAGGCHEKKVAAGAAATTRSARSATDAQ